MSEKADGHLNADEKALRAKQSRAVRPSLASTIVLITGAKDNPKILMGQRAKRHDFMPSVYVFPGGRVDRADSYAPYVSDLSPRTQSILESLYSPRRARAIVLASIRETFEETGLMLGQAQAWTRNLNHSGWDGFRKQGYTPDLSDIEVFGRAVTPPYRHKRFDTWFFISWLDSGRSDIADSAELLNVDWFSFDEIEVLETARATDMMIDVLKSYLSGRLPKNKIFHSHMAHGKFRQDFFP